MRHMLFLSFGVMMACSEQPESSPSTQAVDTPMTVYSFSYPTSYLVERLAGDAVEHSCILPAGEDAASWKPSTEVIIQLQQADLLFSNGLGFEGWVKTAALPSSKSVEAASSVRTTQVTQPVPLPKGGAKVNKCDICGKSIKAFRMCVLVAS